MQRVGVFAVFLGLFSLVSEAAPEIQDPTGILNNLDAQYAAQKWTDAYRVGDEAKYRIIADQCTFSCIDESIFAGLCVPICQPPRATPFYTKKISKTNVERVFGFSSDGEEFEIKPGNPLRDELLKLDLFIGYPGKVILNSITPVQFKIGGVPTDMLEVSGIYETKSGSMELLYRIHLGLPRIASIVSKRVIIPLYRLETITRIEK